MLNQDVLLNSQTCPLRKFYFMKANESQYDRVVLTPVLERSALLRSFAQADRIAACPARCDPHKKRFPATNQTYFHSIFCPLKIALFARKLLQLCGTFAAEPAQKKKRGGVPQHCTSPRTKTYENLQAIATNENSKISGSPSAKTVQAPQNCF